MTELELELELVDLELELELGSVESSSGRHWSCPPLLDPVLPPSASLRLG